MPSGWLIDIITEHFDSEHHSWSEELHEHHRVYKGCFDTPSYIHVSVSMETSVLKEIS